VVEPELSPNVVRVNTKESYLAAAETGGDIGFGSQCELYTLVGYVSPLQLVAHRKHFEGSTMLHVECLPSHLLKVMVETVCYSDVTVRIPTSEVGIVSQAVGTFIVWPKHLVRMTPHIQLVCICSNIFTYVVYILS